MSSPFDWSYFFTFIGGMLVLYWTVFVLAVYLRARMSRVRPGAWFSRERSAGGLAAGALAGAVTPFCSCTTIPIFTAMIESNVSLGCAVSFLIASPTVNPPAIVLFWALFGPQATAAYVAGCLVIAMLGGLLLGGERLKAHVIRVFIVGETPGEFRLREVSRRYLGFLRVLAPVIVVAALIATGLRGWTPTPALIASVAANNWAAVPAAVGLGGVLYADIGMLVPIGKLLLAKGVGTGLVFAFMMAASGVGLPSALLLTRVFKKRLLVLYLATLFGLFTAAGFAASFLL